MRRDVGVWDAVASLKINKKNKKPKQNTESIGLLSATARAKVTTAVDRGDKSVPKIIINDTKKLFFKLQWAFC